MLPIRRKFGEVCDMARHTAMATYRFDITPLGFRAKTIQVGFRMVLSLFLAAILLITVSVYSFYTLHSKMEQAYEEYTRKAEASLVKLRKHSVEVDSQAPTQASQESLGLEREYVSMVNDLIYDLKRRSGVHNIAQLKHIDNMHLSKIMELNEEIAVAYRGIVLKNLGRPSHVEDFFTVDMIEAALMEQYKYGIPASIVLAQAADESAYGRSALAREGNNFFGIKHKESDVGTYVTLYTLEEYTDSQYRYTKRKYPSLIYLGKRGGVHKVKVPQKFRKYRSWWHSFRDHSLFLSGKDDYAKLFRGNGDWMAWCETFKPKREGGVPYATSGSKSERLKGIISVNKLYLLDI